MKLKPRKLVPALLCAAVIGVAALVQTLMSGGSEGFGFLHRLEAISYDWRSRVAAQQSPPAAQNLGFVSISNESIDELRSGAFGFQVDLYWPRFIYGRLVQELDTQGAEAIAFDLLFAGLRPNHKGVSDSPPEHPDDIFAAHLRRAGNVILGAERSAPPHPRFRTNAWALGDISATPDTDGIQRRARAFEDYLIWHDMILEASRKFDGFQFDTNRIVFRQQGRPPTIIPVASDGGFDWGRLLEAATGNALPPGIRRPARAYTRVRAWDLGLTLAARHLKLDLDAARIEPGRRIVLAGPGGIERVIPIDREGRFQIDWSVGLDAPLLTHESIHSLLDRHYRRARGETNDTDNRWRGKLVVVGSVASGNDLTDRGATPLGKDAFLTARYLNTANMLISGRFIREAGLPLELFLIFLLGATGGVVTWKLRALTAELSILLVGTIYAFVATNAFLDNRVWLPAVLPFASLLLTHFVLVTYRAVFEQRESRRIRNLFSKVVSPNVVNELLKAETLSLGGARRHVTVFFSDVRGFTEMTDESHARAEEHVRRKGLPPVEAEAYFDEQAKEVLHTVNLYLGAIADIVKKHDGTLDKYIGDCVMAFWGAPTPNDSHALSSVRAAIDAQRAIAVLNETRAAENLRIEAENSRRARLGLQLLPPLKILSMGTGINTGIVTVGLMGSEQHTFNYTIFGREVNLAARLEGLSGHGRILIGEATCLELRRDDPALADTCRELDVTHVKGFRTAVKVYEVPWQLAPIAPAPVAPATGHRPSGGPLPSVGADHNSSSRSA